MQQNWHAQSIGQVEEALRTGEAGLSSAEAQKRLAANGPNELKAKKKKTTLQMFLEQFKDFMVIILIVAAVVSGFLGGFMEGFYNGLY